MRARAPFAELSARRRWLGIAAAELLIALGLLALWDLGTRFGLFGLLGGDYAVYLAQALALRSGDPPGIYRREVLQGYAQAIIPGAWSSPALVGMVPAPYPPLFAWLVIPFSWPPPPVGFAVWTILNLSAGGYLAWRAARLFPSAKRGWIAVAVISSFPVVDSVLFGQPMILLALAFGEAFFSLQAQRDLRAGLYLSCLLLKPQDALLIGPLLIWKRRWRAVAGLAAGGLLIIAASATIAGLPTLLNYPGAVLGEPGGFAGGATTTRPQDMINWRAALLLMSPEIADSRGLILFGSLGVVTIAALLMIWRGKWLPGERSFPARMTVLILATLLISYHSHAHGAVLLTIPLAATLATSQPSVASRRLVTAGVLVPTILFGVTHSVGWASHLLLFFSFASFVSLWLDLAQGTAHAFSEQSSSSETGAR